MSERTRRIDHLLREEISVIIRRDLGDPRLGFVTITGVDVEPDLRHAIVWASILGSDKERRATLQVLGRAMPFIRHQLGELRLRHIPELHLREDDSAQRSTRVMRILEQLDGDDVAETSGEALAAVLEEEPDLPTPQQPPDTSAAAPPADEVEPPLPPGYRRRVDRDALRRARQRRGR